MGDTNSTTGALPPHFAREARVLILQKKEMLNQSLSQMLPELQGAMGNLEQSLLHADPDRPDYPSDAQKQNQLFASILTELAKFIKLASKEAKAALKINQSVQNFMNSGSAFASVKNIIKAALQHS